MKRRLIALTLLLVLLLTGCAVVNAPDATEPSAVYDWMAGESPMTNQRKGVPRFGLMMMNSTECTESGVYFLYENVKDGDNWVLYMDHGSDSIIKLCGRADCTHDTEECDAYVPGADTITWYDGHLYFQIRSAYSLSERLMRMNMDGTDRVTVLDTAKYFTGYSGKSSSSIVNGIYYFTPANFSEEGDSEFVNYYYRLDGSMEEPAVNDTYAGELTGVEGDALITRYWNDDDPYLDYALYDMETDTRTHLSNHRGYGYYGAEQAYYIREGVIYHYVYATDVETVMVDTGLDENYSMTPFADCFVIADRFRDIEDGGDPNLYIYNWNFELVDTVTIDYLTQNMSAENTIFTETAERFILSDAWGWLPRYYIEKSELGTGNVKIHEFKFPDLTEEDLAEYDYIFHGIE